MGKRAPSSPIEQLRDTALPIRGIVDLLGPVYIPYRILGLDLIILRDL